MGSQPLTSRYLFGKASINKTPLSGTFEISPLCNMDCKMCYIKLNEKEMKEKGRLRTVEEWIELAKEAQKRGMLFLLITGGEPFLYKDFKKLYTELKKLGLMISINTNGTLLDKDTVDWLSKNPPYKINMTVYGGSNETYKKLCNNPKGFDQVTNAASLLKEANISVKLNASITPYNMDDLEAIFDFAKRFDFYIETSTYMFPPVRRNENSIGMGNRFTAKQAGQCAVKIDRIRYEEDELRKRIDSIEYGNFKQSEKDDDCKALEGDRIVCRAGRSSFWVTWDGKITPCGMMTKPYINLSEGSFTECWDKLVEKTEQIRTAKECTNCSKKSVCPICAAIAYTETGDFSKKPDYICNYTDIVLEEYNKIKMSL